MVQISSTSSSPSLDLWEDLAQSLPSATDYYSDALMTDYIGDGSALSKYNPTPGTGKTGLYLVPPNNYPFYSEAERYEPKMQADGGQWSETRAMYAPSPEEAEEDRQRAYQNGIPHGYNPKGPASLSSAASTLKLTVSSAFFTEDEYGAQEREDGTHFGGPFQIEVPASIRVDDLKLLIQEKGGVPVALIKLAYRGVKLVDPNRTLLQYGVAYWSAKFPHWELKLLSL